jgi:hypothetical protein
VLFRGPHNVVVDEAVVAEEGKLFRGEREGTGKIRKARVLRGFYTLNYHEEEPRQLRASSCKERGIRQRTLYFMLRKRPPTRAAKWMTWVGLCFSKSARV